MTSRNLSELRKQLRELAENAQRDRLITDSKDPSLLNDQMY